MCALNGFIAAFLERARSMISAVEIVNIPPTQGLHHGGNTARLPTRHEKMRVVGHKYIRVYLAVMIVAGFF
jgi:hypothetical protein